MKVYKNQIHCFVSNPKYIKNHLKRIICNYFITLIIFLDLRNFISALTIETYWH